MHINMCNMYIYIYRVIYNMNVYDVINSTRPIFWLVTPHIPWVLLLPAGRPPLTAPRGVGPPRRDLHGHLPRVAVRALGWRQRHIHGTRQWRWRQLGKFRESLGQKDAEWMQSGCRMEQNSQVQRKRTCSWTCCSMFSDRLFLGALVWCFVSLTVCRHGDSSLSLGEVLSF